MLRRRRRRRPPSKPGPGFSRSPQYTLTPNANTKCANANAQIKKTHTQKAVAEATGVVLDPVYSGKALHALLGEMRADPAAWAGRRVLFVHTGGLLVRAATRAAPAPRGLCCVLSNRAAPPFCGCPRAARVARRSPPCQRRRRQRHNAATPLSNSNSNSNSNQHHQPPPGHVRQARPAAAARRGARPPGAARAVRNEPGNPSWNKPPPNV